MAFIFPKHAEEQMLRRSLDRNDAESVVLNPEQILDDKNDIDINLRNLQ